MTVANVSRAGAYGLPPALMTAPVAIQLPAAVIQVESGRAVSFEPND